MHTLIGFSLGFFALEAVVAVVEVLMVIVTVAFVIYAALAVIGAVVFSVIGIRRVLARRRASQAPPHVATHQVRGFN